MKRTSSPFKWRHYAPDVILLCVRWYCRYSLSYRDLEEMMRERGLTVDHVTIFRWVQRYAPEINKRMRPHLRMSGTSYRLGETYVKVGTEWKYLYRRDAEATLTGQEEQLFCHRCSKRRGGGPVSLIKGVVPRIPVTPESSAGGSAVRDRVARG